jgi:Domain of unknown function (DUF397)
MVKLQPPVRASITDCSSVHYCALHCSPSAVAVPSTPSGADGGIPENDLEPLVHEVISGAVSAWLGASQQGTTDNLMTAQLPWRRSSFCSAQGCVEVASLPDGQKALRDSKAGDSGTILVFSADEWASFIGGVRAGEFE